MCPVSYHLCCYLGLMTICTYSYWYLLVCSNKGIVLLLMTIYLSYLTDILCYAVQALSKQTHTEGFLG